MQAPDLHLEIPDDTPAGNLPWFVLVVAVAGLLVSGWQLAATLPGELRLQAVAVARAAGEDAVSVSVSGRDLSVSGVLGTGTDPQQFVERIAAIDGVRSVDASLDVFDAQADQRARRAAFAEAIAALDLSAVAFEPSSATVSDGSAPALERLASIMTGAPGFRVRIAGHTDDTGRAETNLRLSRERARAVADWLLGRGVREDQVIAQGYGSTQPIADNATETGRARNRRIEVRDVD